MSDVLLSYGASSVDLLFPVVGYQTDIMFPFDFIQMDDGTLENRDDGVKYDKRLCRASFLLDATKQEEFNTFYNTTARGRNVTMTLASGCGFFPFGADKGDEGVFTVSVERINTPPITQSPFRYFKCDLLFTNVGQWPAYSLPVEIDDGPWTFGVVTACRMPQSMFEPTQKYTISVTHTENSTAQYFDRGSSGDYATTKYIQQCNESKCAAILSYLTSTVRSGTFSIITQNYFYSFGADHGSADTYTVRLNDNKISIKNINHDYYEIELNLKRVS